MSRNFIPQEVINEVRQETDIVDLIGSYINLSKRGSNYMASCPFHEDRNPSFSVSQSKQIFKCFSCGRGGNVFTFIQEIDGLAFPQAVAKVAEFAGIELDSQYTSRQDEFRNQYQHLFDIHQKTMEFYHYYLTGTNNGQNGLDYLLQRDIKQETIETFQLGLAPDNSNLLLDYLKQEGFSDSQLIEAGIFSQSENSGKLYDRFRGRIIIPLRNQQGQTVGFSGRTYRPDQAELAAKYLNSPETAIFKKNSLLFNLDLARLPIRQQQQVLVCEGFMDVIALHQAGFEHSIATMGTSLTQEHVKQLTKMTQDVVFVFDGDDAGLRATERAFEMILPMRNVRARAVAVPNQMDPDDWIRERGADSFQHLITTSQTAFEFMAEYLKRSYNLSEDQQLSQYIERLVELIAALDSPIEQELRIQDIASEFNLSAELLNEQLARKRHDLQQAPQVKQESPVWSDADAPPEAEAELTVTPTTIRDQAAFQSEKQILFNLVFYQEAWDYIEALEKPLVLYHEISQLLFFFLQEMYYDEGYPLPLTGIVDKIKDAEAAQLLSEIIWEQETLGFQAQVMEDCIAVIDRSFLQQEIDELRQDLTLAQKSQDNAQMHDLLVQIMRLTRRTKQGRN